MVAAAMMLAVGCGAHKVIAPGPPPPANSTEFIQVLAKAYRTLDYATFSVLLSDDFRFILDQPNPDNGETSWNSATERRIHSRMFDPDRIPAGDPPLSPDNWLQAVSITLTAQGVFTERPDLYTTFNPPGPLDPVHWIAREATYGYDVFFQLQGETDFAVRGRAVFVVLEDRTKQVGDAGKFLVLRWEDLAANADLATEAGSWSVVKELYRQ